MENETLIPGLPNDVCEQFLAAMPRCALPSLRRVCRSWNKFFSSEKLTKIRRQVEASEGWIYVLAEIPAGAPFRAYDPLTNQWFNLPPTPRRSAEEFWDGFGCVAIGTSLFLMGGVRGIIDVHTQRRSVGVVCGDVLKYDAVENKWSKVASMNSVRSWFAAVTIGDKIYVAGGQGSANFMSSAEVYHSKQNKWQDIGSMQCVRASSTGMALDGEFWVVAGEIEDNRDNNRTNANIKGSAEVFNPKSACWRLVSGMWFGSEKVPGPGAILDGRLIFADNIWLMAYSKETNCWKKLGPLNGVQIFSDSHSRPFSCFGFGCVILDGNVYLIGGNRASWVHKSKYCTTALDTIEVCNIRECVEKGRTAVLPWRTLAPLDTSRGPILAAVVLHW